MLRHDLIELNDMTVNVDPNSRLENLSEKRETCRLIDVLDRLSRSSKLDFTIFSFDLLLFGADFLELANEFALMRERVFNEFARHSDKPRFFQGARAGGSFASVNTEQTLLAKVGKWSKLREFFFGSSIFIGKNQDFTGHDKVHCVGIIAFLKRHHSLRSRYIRPLHR